MSETRPLDFPIDDGAWAGIHRGGVDGDGARERLSALALEAARDKFKLNERDAVSVQKDPRFAAAIRASYTKTVEFYAARRKLPPTMRVDFPLPDSSAKGSAAGSDRGRG